MPNPEQLKVWRQIAGKRLQRLISLQPENEITGADHLIDALIRELGALPSRPVERLAYLGLFGSKSLRQCRILAADRLGFLVASYSAAEIQPVDAQIDALIRELGRLPLCPAGREPYAGLFPETITATNRSIATDQFSVAITPEQLKRIAPHARTRQIALVAQYFSETFHRFEINTPLRQAHFLAQVLHESGSFNYLSEIASGAAYEWRRDLGNTKPGDGKRFKGRGLIQVTGRTNYTELTRYFQGLGDEVDFVADPTSLCSPRYAVLSAGWYWHPFCQQKRRGSLNTLADQDFLEQITLKINGGFNGLEDRKKYLAAAKQVLGVVTEPLAVASK